MGAGSCSSLWRDCGLGDLGTAFWKSQLCVPRATSSLLPGYEGWRNALLCSQMGFSLFRTNRKTHNRVKLLVNHILLEGRGQQQG